MSMSSAKPTVFVNVGNDGPGGSQRPTLLEVGGQNFPPGTAVNINVAAGVRRGTAMVGPDGAFDWSVSVRPRLGCNDTVAVTVHGCDGLEVEGVGTVFCP